MGNSHSGTAEMKFIIEAAKWAWSLCISRLRPQVHDHSFKDVSNTTSGSHRDESSNTDDIDHVSVVHDETPQAIDSSTESRRNDWREDLELNPKTTSYGITGTLRSADGRRHIPNPDSPKSFGDIETHLHEGLLQIKMNEVNLMENLKLSVELAEKCPDLRVLYVCGAQLTLIDNESIVLPARLSSLSFVRCGLRSFEVNLPLQLERLSLEGNRLTHIPACIEILRPSLLQRRLTLNMRDNDFWFSEGVPLSRVDANTIGELCRANDYGILSSSYLMMALRHLNRTGTPHGFTHTIKAKKTTYDNRQSVHIHSVQQSLALAVDKVMNAAPHRPWNRKYLDVLIEKSLLRSQQTSDTRVTTTMLRTSAANALVHSGLNVSFGALCERLVAMIEDMPNEEQRSQVYAAIGRELTWAATSADSHGPVCLTGQFTHLLGALNGIVDGFYVGISAKESLADSLANLRNMWSERCGDNVEEYVQNAIPAAMQLLEDACVPELEQTTWLAGM